MEGYSNITLPKLSRFKPTSLYIPFYFSKYCRCGWLSSELEDESEGLKFQIELLPYVMNF